MQVAHLHHAAILDLDQARALPGPQHRGSGQSLGSVQPRCIGAPLAAFAGRCTGSGVWKAWPMVSLPFCLKRRLGHCRRRECGLLAPLRSEGSGSNMYLCRDGEPWRTQLRRWPTESRDPEVFWEEAVPDGAAVDVLELAGSFARVRTMSGMEGWVQKQYLRGFVRTGHQVTSVGCLMPGTQASGPSVLKAAVPSVSGWKGAPLPRLERLKGVLESLQLRCQLAAEELCPSAARDAPQFLRYAWAAPATAIVLGAWQGGRGITFRGSSSELLRALDLLGYLSVPGDLLDEIIPLELGTSAPSFSCALLGEGADFFLRREALPFGHAVALLAGGPLQVRLRPPESPVPSDALLGHRTAALSRVDLFHHDFAASAELEAELHEGDVLLIPPGWWHQPLALSPAAMAVKPYLSEAMVPPLQRLLCATDLLVKEDTTMSEILRLLGLQLRVGAWPFWPASTPDGSFQDRRRRALEEQPGFVYSGQALPADADLWSKDELQSFIATGGFIQPRRRRLRLPRDAVPRTAAPQLREWLEIPLDQGDLSIPSEDAPKVIWMYWAQGSKQLNGFRRLCVHTWQVQNPDWKIKILEKETVARFIEPSELPRCYEELPAAQQSDALRLALLAKYGGVYTDVATICLRPLEDWLWGSMSDGTLEQGLGGELVSGSQSESSFGSCLEGPLQYWLGRCQDST
ncbi:unnamed protein product [Durusdinium trenchii]|uniref:JmjC domain-containing protein n=1 Tax=Durusdinium trenchii TaxID=1381693 RepID=A0ABP0R8G9_9DINO